jgi:hypothetical protein
MIVQLTTVKDPKGNFMVQIGSALFTKVQALSIAEQIIHACSNEAQCKANDCCPTGLIERPKAEGADR